MSFPPTNALKSLDETEIEFSFSHSTVLDIKILPEKTCHKILMEGKKVYGNSGKGQ